MHALNVVLIYFSLYLLLGIWYLITSITNDYSKVRNKRTPRLVFLKKNPTPLRLLIFGFSSLAPRKFEQCKTYYEIDFFECFRFQCYF